LNEKAGRSTSSDTSIQPPTLWALGIVNFSFILGVHFQPFHIHWKKKKGRKKSNPLGKPLGKERTLFLLRFCQTDRAVLSFLLSPGVRFFLKVLRLTGVDKAKTFRHFFSVCVNIRPEETKIV